MYSYFSTFVQLCAKMQNCADAQIYKIGQDAAMREIGHRRID